MQSSYPDDIQGACFDVTDDEGDAVLWRYWRISLYMARVVVLEDVEVTAQSTASSPMMRSDMQHPDPEDIRGAFLDVAGGNRDAVLRNCWRISLFMARILVLDGVDGEPTPAQRQEVRRTAWSIYLNIADLPYPATAG
ncbi:hypothetical protein IscW_ISCW012456 [Ixodes scapularis]|uniref:Uncharacterized protein n=1 Tax=Ixodes scapularis TaxID=6945 RepID=B7QFR8_IXOSC|nr:hypothetical protein IscW_ISCW012456 [Ixodes scapularis]|eukprot:XP_002414382.1 hypothetical protein IscW_ISCW012456 [Ixodes scapularis]